MVPLRTRPSNAGSSLRLWERKQSSVTRAAAKDHQTEKTAAEKKKKTTITAESFDRQVADKMGEFFEKTFLPAIKKMVEASMSYDEVKRRLKTPSTWGAKITGEQFKERATLDKQ
jgi:hypothetical protein